MLARLIKMPRITAKFGLIIDATTSPETNEPDRSNRQFTAYSNSLSRAVFSSFLVCRMKTDTKVFSLK